MIPDGAASRRLIYIVDPMCSWCWGFAPVIQALQNAFRDRLTLDVIAGGLRPGTTEGVTAAVRTSVLNHWHEVERATGQPFEYEGALPEEFIYDTEPPCRALVTIRSLNRDVTLDYVHGLQGAFYRDGRDITRASVLADLARDFGVEEAAFLRRFDSDEMLHETGDDFSRAREMGINAFPAVILDDGATKKLLTLGYLPFNALQPRVQRWLDEREGERPCAPNVNASEAARRDTRPPG